MFSQRALGGPFLPGDNYAERLIHFMKTCEKVY